MHTEKHGNSGPPLSLPRVESSRPLPLPQTRDIRSLVLDTRPYSALTNHWAATSRRQPCCPSSPAAGARRLSRAWTAQLAPDGTRDAESFIINDSTDWRLAEQQWTATAQLWRSIYLLWAPDSSDAPQFSRWPGSQADSAGISGFPARNLSRLHPFWLSIVARKIMSKTRVLVKQQAHASHQVVF